MKNKDVLMQVLCIFLCEAACIGVMLLAYSLMDRLNSSVLLGALAGGLIAIGNFLFLSISVCRAAERARAGGEDAAAKAKLAIQRNSILRKVVLIIIYIIVLKSGYFDILSTILPLVFVQASVYLTEFFRKGGEKAK